MLTKEELLECNTIPNFNDISLKLYKDFSTEYLLPYTFHYVFSDGQSLDIKFTEWGIYHILAIQHIDHKINKSDFFNYIDAGLDLTTFTKSKKQNSRLKKYKKRITLFACIYYCLTYGTVFYVSNGSVINTNNVKMDYILYIKVLNNSPCNDNTIYNGMNLGIRQCDNLFVPLTLLVSKSSNIKEYVEENNIRVVKKMIIYNKHKEIILEKEY